MARPWRAALSAGAGAIVLIALGAPAEPVLLGAALAFGWTWRGSESPSNRDE